MEAVLEDEGSSNGGWGSSISLSSEDHGGVRQGKANASPSSSYSASSSSFLSGSSSLLVLPPPPSIPSSRRSFPQLVYHVTRSPRVVRLPSCSSATVSPNVSAQAIAQVFLVS